MSDVIGVVFLHPYPHIYSTVTILEMVSSLFSQSFRKILGTVTEIFRTLTHWSDYIGSSTESGIQNILALLLKYKKVIGSYIGLLIIKKRICE